MRSIIIGAGTDLGVHIDGARLGPKQLINDIKSFYTGEIVELNQDNSIIKSRNIADRTKNKYEINRYNESLYKTVSDKLSEDLFPITIGGDNTVSIASSLASAKMNEDVGIIWISADSNYHTFQTTMTGNMCDLSLAAITGYECNDLTPFHHDQIIQPAKSVIVGVRELSKGEKENLRYAGVTYFTIEDIRKEGIDVIMKKAYDIASYKTKNIHISFNLNIIDSEVAHGVSIPKFDGLNNEEVTVLYQYILNHLENVSSFDLVELNPLRDTERKTEQIALNILANLIKKIDN